MTRGRRRPPGAYQGSASDPASIKRGERLENECRRQEAQAMVEALNSQAARRVLWMVLSRCHMLQEVWDPSVLMHKLAGEQAIGHFLVAKICAVDSLGFLKMQREAHDRGLRDAATVEAMDTSSALTEDDDATEAGS